MHKIYLKDGVTEWDSNIHKDHLKNLIQRVDQFIFDNWRWGISGPWPIRCRFQTGGWLMATGTHINEEKGQYRMAVIVQVDQDNHLLGLKRLMKDFQPDDLFDIIVERAPVVYYAFQPADASHPPRMALIDQPSCCTIS